MHLVVASDHALVAVEPRQRPLADSGRQLVERPHELTGARLDRLTHLARVETAVIPDDWDAVYLGTWPVRFNHSRAHLSHLLDVVHGAYVVEHVDDEYSSNPLIVVAKRPVRVLDLSVEPGTLCAGEGTATNAVVVRSLEPVLSC